MIRIVGKSDREIIRWDHADSPMMARLGVVPIGKKRRTTYSASILKLADRRGLTLSKRARRRLDLELSARRQFETLKQLKDAPGAERLFPHQRVDINYFAATQLPAYLVAHEASVGKTPEAIVWNDKLLRANLALVVCPNSVKTQWRREIRRWGSGADVAIVDGTIAEQSAIIKNARSGWLIVHWEALVHASDALLAREWDVVIADEAHLAQNRNAARSETLFCLNAKFRMALTGDPYAHDVSEMWSILHFLYPDRYPAFWRFAGLHVETQHGFGGAVEFVGSRRPKLLQWEIAPFTIRRTVDEVRPDVPKLRVVERIGELTTRGRREYKRIQREFFAELDTLDGSKKLPILNVLARTTRQRQYLVDPALVGAIEDSVKYPVVDQLMDDIRKPVVIFTEFAEAAIKLKAFLKTRGWKVGLFIGKRPHKASRERDKQQFLNGKLDALIVTGKAGGIALNLAKHGYVIHLDLPWRARDWKQRNNRVNRPEEGTGRVIPCMAYFIVIRDSYEERMMANLEAGHREFKKVFTVGELRELFAA